MNTLIFFRDFRHFFNITKFFIAWLKYAERMQCNICFERIDVFGVIPCNHNNCCAICLFKEIVLFNNRKCPICKVRDGNSS